MAETYGVEGSGTYAVAYSSLDDMIGVFKDNTTNDISAADTRNALLTLWSNAGGGGSFSYTQTLPLTTKSTQGVGGIGAGRTFSNVPLQVLFDSMFFPAVGSGLSISANPSSFELGKPNPKTTIKTTITRNTPPINSANVSGGPGNEVIFTSPTPNIPQTTGTELSTSYANVSVQQDTATDYTLTIFDPNANPTKTTVSWYFPRWVGTVYLGRIFGDTNLDTKTLTQDQKDRIYNEILDGNNLLGGRWQALWDPTFSAEAKFSEYTGQVSQADISGPVNTTNGAHIVFVFLSSDYGADGTPASYKIGATLGGAQVASPQATQVLIKSNIKVKNRYGVERDCHIWVTSFKLTGPNVILIG